MSTTVVVVVATPMEKFGSMTLRTIRFVPRLNGADTCGPVKTGPPLTVQVNMRGAPLVDVLPPPFRVTAAPFGRLHSTVAGTLPITATGGLVTFVPDSAVTVEVAPDSVCENGSNDTAPVTGLIVPVIGLALNRSKLVNVSLSLPDTTSLPLFAGIWKWPLGNHVPVTQPAFWMVMPRSEWTKTGVSPAVATRSKSLTATENVETSNWHPMISGQL